VELNITAYSKVGKRIGGLDSDIEHNPRHVRIYRNETFPGRCDEFESGIYEGYSDLYPVRADLYSFWRLVLLCAAIDETPYEPLKKGDMPFYELANFTDSEGTLGTAVCKKLHEDFIAHREKCSAFIEKWNDPDQRRFLEKYDDWTAATKLASDGGCIRFH